MKKLNRLLWGELVTQRSKVVNWVKKIFPYYYPSLFICELFSLWKWAVQNTDFWGIGFFLWYQFIYNSNMIFFFFNFIKILHKVVCGFAYGRFFLRTKTFGHNAFCTALHVMKMDNFNYVNFKISNKNN